MKGKIFRTTLAVTMVTLVVCISLVLGMLYAFVENNYTVELKNEVDYIASSIDAYGIGFIENVDFGNVRVSYIDCDGTVLFDNKADVNVMANHMSREEINEALKTGYGDSARLSETLSEKTYYIAKKLSNGDVVRVSDTRASEWALMARLLRHILLVVLISVVLSAFCSVRLAKNVVKPINEIDLSEPEKCVVYDELTPLLKRVSQQNRQISEQIDLLQKERTEFEQITSNMSEGVIVIDTATNILSMNSAARGIFSDSNQIKGESVYNLNRAEKFIKCVDNALAGRRKTTIWEENGRFISVFANPVREDGHVIGAIILLMDVTEREGRETLRREFTANVSHELKTPLTSISAAAEMMMNEMVKSEDIAMFSEKIYNEAQRLISLVNDIIKLSKLDEGEELAEFKPYDISLCVKKSLEAVKVMAEKKNIAIEEDIDTVTINCIETLIGEIVYNLCDNAVRYTPEGGRVSVSLKKIGERARLIVSDTGVGIPISEQERIFERFYRVEKSHNTKDGGTGLGLSIVKHAVRIHKGKVNIESREGKGSKFTVVI